MRYGLPAVCLLALVGNGHTDEVPVACKALGLIMDGSTGAIISAKLDDRVVSPQAGGGGFAVADYATDKQLKPFAVALQPSEEGIAYEGVARGLRLSGGIRALPEGIDITGLVQDTSGADRAISLRFAIPVEAEGWQWSRDLRVRAPIREGLAFDNSVKIGLGSGRLDLWPLSAINSSTATLALATRIDEPAVFHCSYDPTDALFAIQLDFCLTQLAKKLPRRAPFHFTILAHDMPFGMRSALAAYYATFPDLFVKRTDKLGGWFAWGDVLHLKAPISDFGLMFHEGPTAEGHESDARLGIPRFPYIEPGMFQLHFGDLDHEPSREEIMGRLGDYAAQADDPAQMEALADRDQWNRKMCRAILKSGIRDPEGDLVIARVGQYSWVAGSRWAAQFPLLLDPDIEHGAAATYLDYIRDNAPKPEWGEGRYLDSYSAHIRSVDYSPDALAVADFPPCFDEQLRPCQLMAIPMFEYVEALGRLLDEHQKTILVNAYGHPAPFPFHRFDILGKEHWASASGRLFEKYRCMAYQKVVTDLPAYEAIDGAFIDEFLVYGIYPGGYGRGNWGQEQMREHYRRVVPLLRLESRLGWQPINWAATRAPEVKVERYGSPPGPMLFAVHNPYTPKEVVLDIDLRGVGHGDLMCLDLLRGRPLDWVSTKTSLRVRAGMAARATALIAVGDATAFTKLYGMLAQDKLEDVALCAREWELRRGARHPRAKQLAAACRARTPEQMRTALAGLGALEPADDPLNARMSQLLSQAAEALAKADAPPDLQPAGDTVVPQDEATGAKLPFIESFDTLDPNRWRLEQEQVGIQVRDGRLTMQLPEKGARSVGITSQEFFDFGTRPLNFTYKFQFNHGGHRWYLMQSFRLAPTAGAGADDFLHIRCDPGLCVRLENAETPASGYTRSLTPYQGYKTNAPHEVSLTIDGERYRLLIDGQLHGEGPHGMGFAAGYLSLGLYSGHYGHGDTCWFDDLRVEEGHWAE